MPTTTTPMTEVIDAMRSLQTEDDRWSLAEALVRQVPKGKNGFDTILDAATAAGVAGSLKPTTLRLYRDTAVRWPAADRIPNVSFSAHREAMVLIASDGNTAAAVRVLTDLAKNLGPGKVTVASVRRAIAVQSGKALPATAATKAKAQSTLDVLKDIAAGGPVLIAAITADSELDKLHSGLTKVIAHVERLRAKAARKAKAPAKVAAKPAAAKAAAASSKPQGDLRGL